MGSINSQSPDQYNFKVFFSDILGQICLYNIYILPIVCASSITFLLGYHSGYGLLNTSDRLGTVIESCDACFFLRLTLGKQLLNCVGVWVIDEDCQARCGSTRCSLHKQLVMELEILSGKDSSLYLASGQILICMIERF